ncbi:uncharacterized protein LOC129596180 [Paramacrobiotus metropolitanus]|uniref:uncharacterized protein LOC129596180 n=1 Tax=Paramacrobiotus metropolitanus TaxID=2943436 RepID=UPI0024462A3D|nr:uncharacterized protein LOC129596180 [Paramacrobiotus metropolitanus]XP_055349355.1 uncharacterized protein LOC129596180 [Paramacrobiotus metropolitanus]
MMADWEELQEISRKALAAFQAQMRKEEEERVQALAELEMLLAEVRNEVKEIVPKARRPRMKDRIKDQQRRKARLQKDEKRWRRMERDLNSCAAKLQRFVRNQRAAKMKRA